MNSPNHFETHLAKHSWILLPVVCAAGFLSWQRVSQLPRQSEIVPVNQVAIPAATRVALDTHWTPFVRKDAKIGATGSTLRSRFRLAGIFSANAGVGEQRRAVIDDNQATSQQIISEHDSLSGDVTVAQIGSDFVILRHFGTEEKLTLGGDASAAGLRNVAGEGASLTKGSSTPVAPEAVMNTFGGRQVSENRWVFSRQKLLEYYAQLRDEPERLVKVFDSLKPVYTDDRKISGYRLKAEGERAFFDAVGLREGDVIRSVNSMKMTNRRRAEMMIRDFVENRSSAFVFEVERDGKPQTQIYSVP